VLVALVGSTSGPDAVEGFKDGYIFLTAAALAAAIAIAFIGRLGFAPARAATEAA
jgi:hypothetical protein